jgi:glycosyltransferase involved in cell wall biosynthesis
MISYLLHLPGTMAAFRRLLREENITVVNVHYVTLAAITVILACKYSLTRRKLMLSFHGADLAAARNAKRIARLIWRFALAHVDAVVLCSGALAQEFVACFPSFRGKVMVVHNGIDQGRTVQDAREGRVPDRLAGKRLILNVATLEWKKGQDVLIKAFAQIAAQFPEHILVLMGRSAGAKAKIDTLIDRLRLNNRVVIVENVPHNDVLATMQQAELFVLPSRIEPFGIVILEAGLCGVPVVASRTGGITEIVKHEIDGILVEPENVDDLARAMRDVLSGERNCDDLRQHLYERVVTEFTWIRAAAEYGRLMRA